MTNLLPEGQTNTYSGMVSSETRMLDEQLTKAMCATDKHLLASLAPE